MAVKTSWHRPSYGMKLRHCHPVYFTAVFSSVGGDLRFFAPERRHGAPMGGDIWSGDIPRQLLSPSVHGRGVGAKNAKFYLHFTKFRNINASHRRLACMIFMKFSLIGELLAGSCVKWRFGQGVPEVRGLKFVGPVTPRPQLFSTSNGETMLQTQTF